MGLETWPRLIVGVPLTLLAECKEGVKKERNIFGFKKKNVKGKRILIINTKKKRMEILMKGEWNYYYDFSDIVEDYEKWVHVGGYSYCNYNNIVIGLRVNSELIGGGSHFAYVYAKGKDE